VASHVDSIQLVPNLFDVLFCDGEMLIDLPFEQRRERLEEMVHSHVAPQLVSDDVDEIENFYRKALDDGHEGIMVKSLSAPYSPGARVREWVKIKPAVDTIDLVVTSAEWGEGKRAGVYGSFLLACLDEGRLVPISRVATGFSDEDLQEVYAMLKELVLSSHGKEVEVEPLLVVEVGYAEIQKSVNYEGGFALRFPRFIRIRDDKGVDEIETLSSIKERFAAQG
jgi:DNA ligase-1